MPASQTNILDQVHIHREDNRYVFTGRISWMVETPPQQAPDLLQREVEHMGQQLKREIYGHLLQEVEQQIVAQFQIANPHLQRRGSRPYTFVAPFGEVPIQRTRVFDSPAKTWSVPAEIVWQTPHRRCLLPGLKEAVCQQVQDLSVRGTSRALAEQAGVEKLICPATVVHLFHEEGRQLDQRQQEQAQTLLAQHAQAISCGLAESPQAQDELSALSAEDEQEASGLALSAEELEEVRERALGFLRPDSPEFQELAHPHDNHQDNHEAEDVSLAELPAGEHAVADCTLAEPVACRCSRSKRRVDEGWVVFQPDEVQTKAQASQPGKRNDTYTATVDVEDRTYYLVASCASLLWSLAAALLANLGVTDGRRGLLLVGDGASWIRCWYRQVVLAKKEMVLCWYHLTKRVYERLSQGGFSKARRQELERLLLGHLWRGEVAQAVWCLWGVREEARNGFWITQLIQYLLARREYLPNYSARHEAGLWIASTRVEKWNDLAVSQRCKRRGMSWTAEGVLALALHKAQQRNDPTMWDSIQQPSQAA